MNPVGPGEIFHTHPPLFQLPLRHDLASDLIAIQAFDMEVDGQTGHVGAALSSTDLPVVFGGAVGTMDDDWFIAQELPNKIHLCKDFSEVLLYFASQAVIYGRVSFEAWEVDRFFESEVFRDLHDQMP